jgi:hypothetical protein
MGAPQKAIRSSPSPTSAAQVDQILSELSRLYLERFKAMRSDDKAAVQSLTDQIEAFKSLLEQI